MQLKIVSFNMKRTAFSAARNHWSRRVEAIQSFFDAEKPDIVGTQEMIFSYIKNAQERMPEYDWVGEGRNGGSLGEYTAIFYRKNRLRAVDWGVFWLSKTPNVPSSRSWFSLFPRTCTYALLESLEDGSRVFVYNTHLDHVSMLARLRGLQLIKRHIQEHASGYPVVLTGDFNATPQSGALRALTSGALQEGLPDSYNALVTDTIRLGRTYHGFRGKKDGRPIDYIFASSSMTVLQSYVDRQTYANRYPSDHYPVVIVVST